MSLVWKTVDQNQAFRDTCREIEDIGCHIDGYKRKISCHDDRYQRTIIKG